MQIQWVGGWACSMCILNKFPGDGAGPKFEQQGQRMCEVVDYVDCLLTSTEEHQFFSFLSFPPCLLSSLPSFFPSSFLSFLPPFFLFFLPFIFSFTLVAQTYLPMFSRNSVFYYKNQNFLFFSVVLGMHKMHHCQSNSCTFFS